MKKHGSWAAEVGWFFRHLFSTIDSTTGESLKGWAYAPMEILRGPGGALLGVGRSAAPQGSGMLPHPETGRKNRESIPIVDDIALPRRISINIASIKSGSEVICR